MPFSTQVGNTGYYSRMSGSNRSRNSIDRYLGKQQTRIPSNEKSILSLGTDASLRRILFPGYEIVSDIYDKKSFTTSDLYSTPALRMLKRRISGHAFPIIPELVLDAPGMIDDFYLNLLDWSDQDILVVALSDTVYLWNAKTHQITQLYQIPLSITDESSHEGIYVSSVHFISSFCLAIGLSNGIVQIWDIFKQVMLYQLDEAYLEGMNNLERTLSSDSFRSTLDDSILPPSNRVSSISSNTYNCLSTGCRLGAIRHYDLRSEWSHVMSTATGSLHHDQEVCGMEWKDELLASGGNDNFVFVWDIRNSLNEPLFQFKKHCAAVKALGWCPWRRHILATGGGSADKQLCIWNTHNGDCIESIQTDSQICSLKWSILSSELVTGHGYARNELVVWAWPHLTKLVNIQAHHRRILHLAKSPDGTTIVSTAYDENLKFWRLFDFSEKQNEFSFKR